MRAAGALRKIIVGALADRQTSQFGPQFWPAIGALFTALNDPNRLVSAITLMRRSTASVCWRPLSSLLEEAPL